MPYLHRLLISHFRQQQRLGLQRESLSAELLKVREELRRAKETAPSPQKSLVQSLLRELAISEADLNTLIEELADAMESAQEKADYEKELTLLRNALTSRDEETEK